jgi:hypothetical protein
VFVDEHVAAVQDLYGDLVGDRASERTRYDQVQLLADRLSEGFRSQHLGAFVELHNWHPTVGPELEQDVWRLPFERSDFVLTVARGHGFERVDDLVPDGVTPWPPFETAVDTMLRGDVAGLRAQLEDDPGLALRASHWPHRATLLHYAAANGVEIYRQVVPRNLPELVALLIDRGADVGAPARAYGADLRPLDLLLTSGHPHEAGVTGDVAALLRAPGAHG